MDDRTGSDGPHLYDGSRFDLVRGTEFWSDTWWSSPRPPDRPVLNVPRSGEQGSVRGLS